MRNVTTKTVAAALGVSDRSVRLYAASGRIPFTRTPGGHRRFDVDEVRAALERSPSSTPPTLESLRRHRRAITVAAANHGATHIRVFGSVASGTSSADSDIDLLVTLERGRSYADIDDLEADLEALLGRPVDVVTDGAVHGHMTEVADTAVVL